MAQLEAMRLDALLTTVQAHGRMAGAATPAIDTVLAPVRKRAEIAGA